MVQSSSMPATLRDALDNRLNRSCPNLECFSAYLCVAQRLCGFNYCYSHLTAETQRSAEVRREPD